MYDQQEDRQYEFVLAASLLCIYVVDLSRSLGKAVSKQLSG